MKRLSKYTQAPEVRQRVVHHGGDEFVLKGELDGDTFFAVMYPEAKEVRRLSKHLAAVIGQQEPLKESLVEDMLAVQTALQPGEGEEAADIAQIALVYKRSPVLFIKLRRAAVEALGVDELGDVAGPQAWQTILSVLTQETEDEVQRAGVLFTATQIARQAMTAFLTNKELAVDDPEDQDRVMEALEGNSEGSGESGPPSTTGASEPATNTL